MLPSLVQRVVTGRKQFCGPSLQRLLHSPPPAHGSPAWMLHEPPLQVSAPLQNILSLQGALFAGCTQEPLPLHWSLVHTLPSSVQWVPAVAVQVSVPSLQVLLHSGPAAHGSPAWTLQPPPEHVSAPLQNSPSSHGALLALWTQPFTS